MASDGGGSLRYHDGSHPGLSSSGSLIRINTELAQSAHDNSSRPGTASSTDVHSIQDFSPGTSYTAATSYMPTTPLHGGSIWSPIPPNGEFQSATTPSEMSWGSYVHPDSPLRKQAHLRTPERIASVEMPPSTAFKSARGLGLQFGKPDGDYTGERASILPGLGMIPSPRSFGAATNYRDRSGVGNAQPGPFGTSAPKMSYGASPPAGMLVRKPSDGINQPPKRNDGDKSGLPMPGQDIHTTPNRADTGAPKLIDTPTNKTIVHPKAATKPEITASPTSSFTSPGKSSTASKAPTDQTIQSDMITDWKEAHPELIGQPEPVWAQEAHPDSWSRHAMDSRVPLAEAFEGAQSAVKAVNGSHYKMTYGSRAVCIKTDTVENVYWSFRTGQWTAMDKVGQRIMRLWESRIRQDDKILLLFSVSGQKSYCGLAEMTGPWSEGGNLEGWVDPLGGAATLGTMPLTWKYVKNVPFTSFSEITHEHNGQPIVNMWNGMHFPWETGRKVIQIFIETPHFTNLMCYRKDKPYDPRRGVGNPAELDPRLHNRRGNTTFGRSGQSWRPPVPQRSMDQQSRGQVVALNTHRRQQLGPEETPTPHRWNRGVMTGTNTAAAPPPKFDEGAVAAPSAGPGDMVTVTRSYIVDANGKLVPVASPEPSQVIQSTNAVAPQRFNQQVSLQHRASTKNLSNNAGRGGHHQGNDQLGANQGAGSPKPGERDGFSTTDGAYDPGMQQRADSVVTLVRSESGHHDVRTTGKMGEFRKLSGASPTNFQRTVSTIHSNSPRAYNMADQDTSDAGSDMTTDTNVYPSRSSTAQASATSPSMSRFFTGSNALVKHSLGSNMFTPTSPAFNYNPGHRRMPPPQSPSVYGFRTPSGHPIYPMPCDGIDFSEAAEAKMSIRPQQQDEFYNLYKHKMELERQLEHTNSNSGAYGRLARELVNIKGEIARIRWDNAEYAGLRPNSTPHADRAGGMRSTPVSSVMHQSGLFSPRFPTSSFGQSPRPMPLNERQASYGLVSHPRTDSLDDSTSKQIELLVDSAPTTAINDGGRYNSVTNSYASEETVFGGGGVRLE